VAQVNEDQPFSFTWLALKLLGQGLYSNPWSALSELVANGLDAGATTVSVYIDLRTKSRARVEIFDNGIGMSRDDIRIYAQVGHNKRSSADTTVPSFVTSPMGRKGIGKLAALYLARGRRRLRLAARRP
jgi:HSP90 family molecular chaperone